MFRLIHSISNFMAQNPKYNVAFSPNFGLYVLHSTCMCATRWTAVLCQFWWTDLKNFKLEYIKDQLSFFVSSILYSDTFKVKLHLYHNHWRFPLNFPYIISTYRVAELNVFSTLSKQFVENRNRAAPLKFDRVHTNQCSIERRIEDYDSKNFNGLICQCYYGI